MQKILSPLLPVLLIIIISSCKKDDFITSTDARISVVDSVKFDTLFTTTGSVTRSFKIFNDNNQKLLISKIRLAGGSASPFNLNINGVPSNDQSNIEMAPNDSIYIFVTVSINPTFSNLPFVISDSILIQYNGISRYVQLEAYGQNAVFLRNTVITGNVTFSNNLPYVILEDFRVDTSAILTIEPGTRMYFHADAPLIVDGTLIVNGTVNQKIVFRSDRLDQPYKDFPGSWPGIIFRAPSKNNVLVFAEIRNAYQGILIQGPSVNSNPKLKMQQMMIDNAYDAGILSTNSSIEMNNSLITNSGNNIVIQLGGNYNFTNCTIAGYSTKYLVHSKPVLSVSDFGFLNGGISYASLNASFINCIMWGDNNVVANEIVINKQGNNSFNVTLDHCLYKASNDPPNTNLVSVIKNMDPVFDTIDYTTDIFNFRISNPNAPGINKGVATPFARDLDNNPRNIGLPDLGCFEKQ